MTLRTWVLYYSGRDWRRVQTCIQIRADWLVEWRKRHVADGDTILAVYREKQR